MVLGVVPTRTAAYGGLALLALVTLIAVLAAYVSTTPHIATEPRSSNIKILKTTVINGIEYYMAPLAFGGGVSEDMVIQGVKFVKLPVTTTGCVGDWFLVLFPDGATEVLQVYYSCTSTPTKEPLALTKHTCPRAGVLYQNGKLYALVSKECVGTVGNVISKRVGNWLIRLIIPRNITLKNHSRILYEVIYVGESFLATSDSEPPTSCLILVQRPDGGTATIYDCRLCPQFRENATYVMPGYTYKHWIDLSKVASDPGTYRITLFVNCLIHKICLPTENVGNLKISTFLSIVLKLN